MVDTLIVCMRLPSPQWENGRAGLTSRERFGFAVRARREELGLIQEDLAEKAGIHRTYLSDIERGSRNVSIVTLAGRAKPQTLARSLAV
jgi:DNA-binding XRE family transcriptional regulator